MVRTQRDLHQMKAISEENTLDTSPSLCHTLRNSCIAETTFIDTHIDRPQPAPGPHAAPCSPYRAGTHPSIPSNPPATLGPAAGVGGGAGGVGLQWSDLGSFGGGLHEHWSYTP